jgi:hypothetical protein
MARMLGPHSSSTQQRVDRQKSLSVSHREPLLRLINAVPYEFAPMWGKNLRTSGEAADQETPMMNSCGLRCQRDKGAHSDYRAHRAEKYLGSGLRRIVSRKKIGFRRFVTVAGWGTRETRHTENNLLRSLLQMCRLSLRHR